MHNSYTSPQYHKERGDNYRSSNQFDPAIREYKLALSINHNYWQAHANLSLAYEAIDQTDNAIIHANKALLINHIPELHDNLGRILYQANRFTESIKHHKGAIKLKPEMISAHINLANALRSNGQFNDAISAYKETIRLSPQYKNAHVNLAHILRHTNRIKEAIISYNRARHIDPEDITVLSNLFICYRTICDWKNADKLSNKIFELYNTLPTRNTTITPFTNLYLEHNALLLLKKTTEWSNKYFTPYYNKSKFTFQSTTKNKHRRIKIGYISHDFRNHPIGILTHKLFRHHNRKKFETYIYSYGPDTNDKYRSNIVLECDVFREASHLDDISTARLIFHDKIDILIDLTGFTSGGRHKICAYKPSPIQINYLGFPGSSGTIFFDYIITDNILTPAGYERYYSEKLIRLPNCYQVNSLSYKAPTSKRSRNKMGLPENSIVFCSFNNPKKIDSKTFDSWLKILSKVDNSVLWLLKNSSDHKENILQETKKRGINQNRIIFAESVSLSEHIARHTLADIALDTFNYGGGITTSLALISNVPVVTLPRDTYVSRMSASLLTAVSLEDLISNTYEEYELKAIELALDKKRLHKIKQLLHANITKGTLLNTRKFTKTLEDAYCRIWRNHLDGKKPSHQKI